MPLGALKPPGVEIVGGGTWKQLSGEPQQSTSKKTTKPPKIPGVELPLVGFSEGGWRNSGLSQGCPPPSLDPPTVPAQLPAKPVPICCDPSPAQGPFLLLVLRSAAPSVC